MKTFGTVLRELREKRGMTVNQLGIYSEVSPALISKIENGKRGTPKPETIEKLAKGLKMEYTDLMQEAGYIEEAYHNGSIVNESAVTYKVNDPRKQKLLDMYDKLPKDKQHILDQLAEVMIKELGLEKKDENH